MSLKNQILETFAHKKGVKSLYKPNGGKMAKIAIVTDSTSYIPADLSKKHNISVAPQVLIWEGQTYKDGIDITPQEFYSRLKTAKVMPTTSQVSVVSFQEIFQGLV